MKILEHLQRFGFTLFVDVNLSAIKISYCYNRPETFLLIYEFQSKTWNEVLSKVNNIYQIEVCDVIELHGPVFRTSRRQSRLIFAQSSATDASTVCFNSFYKSYARLLFLPEFNKTID